MDDTSLELSFGPGTFRFWLPLPMVVRIERECGAPRQGDAPAYPKSIFTIYDQLSGGLGLKDDAPVYLGGGAAIVNDVRQVLLAGLEGGNYGMVDGEEIEVGPIKARELLADYVFPARPLIESVHLAWAILHKAITGIDLKKKAEPDEAETPNRSEKAN